MRRLDYRIPAELDGVRVDHYLRQTHGYSATLLRRLKTTDHILCNGKAIRMIDPLHQGDLLTICLDEHCDITPNPFLKADIIFADEDLIVYNKPAFLPVHPSIGHAEDTLANLFAATQQGGFHPINRLDANTTGLCLIARHAFAATALSGTVEKEYTALVCGHLTEKHGTICAPITREDGSIIRRAVSADGKYSVTHYQVLEEFDSCSLVQVRLETGRTHQIRVHFAHLGHPLAGDDLYGGNTSIYRHHMLSCTALTFPHPISGKVLSFRINMQI